MFVKVPGTCNMKVGYFLLPISLTCCYFSRSRFNAAIE